MIDEMCIRARTYPKEAFYRDVKSNVRLITPIYTLEEIASGEWTPFVFLEDAFQHLVADGTRDALASYEYQDVYKRQVYWLI